jgi:hypothetical protein
VAIVKIVKVMPVKMMIAMANNPTIFFGNMSADLSEEN